MTAKTDEGYLALQELDLLAAMIAGGNDMPGWDNPAEAAARIDFWIWALRQSEEALASIVRDGWHKWGTMCPSCGLAYSAYTKERKSPPSVMVQCEVCSHTYWQVWLPMEWGT